jgi:F0F1-type ATP synthase assembly protein I
MVNIALILIGIIIGVIIGFVSSNPYIGLGIALTIEFGVVFSIMEEAGKKKGEEI